MEEGALVSDRPPGPRGRGASSNPVNRFQRMTWERDADWDPEQDPAPATQFLRDRSDSVSASSHIIRQRNTLRW